MIARTHRFRGHNSLRFVYQNGRTLRSTSLGLRFAVNSRRKTYRCAVVVSKKISKSAVVRNRIRRRIYEIVRTQEVLMELPLDLVFTIYSEDVATMPGHELTDTVVKLITQCALDQRTKGQRAILDREES